MTVDPSKLQSILDRLEAGNPLKSEDLEILVAGLATKQVIMATGKSAVALGTSADGATITSGDRNIVISKELAQTIQEKVGGNIDLHSGDRHTVNNYTFLIVNSDSTEKNNLLLQQLTLLLKDVDPAIIQQAYQASLPRDAMRVQKKDIVSDINDFRQIPAFIDRLIGSDSISQEIRDNLEHSPLRSNVPNSIESSQDRVLDSYLSIVITQPILSLDNLFINACLTPDNTLLGQPKSSHALDLDENTQGVYGEWDEIPALLDKLLLLTLNHRELLGKKYELTIEIFLPMNYLCADVDRWMVSDFFDDIPLGVRYQTIVRSSERLDPRYLCLNESRWRRNWDRIPKDPNQKPICDDFETLDRFDDRDWQALVTSLYQEKLGLKLTCELIQEHKQDLFKAILNSATPVAIWSRCDPPDLDLTSEIDNLITGNPLLRLSSAVLKKRQQARSDCHLGTHLAILWENPERLKRFEPLKPAGY